MENPYWSSEGQKHHLNIDSIRLLCFELLCLFEASKPLMKEVENIELEEGEEISIMELALQSLHENFAFEQCSKILLQLALLLRTYDDQMKDSEKSEQYKNHLEKIDDGNSVGSFSESDFFSLREACNKIIHAIEIRPLFERIDRVVNDENLNQDLWYLTGEIELSGKRWNQPWNATIYVKNFLITVLESIELGKPS